MIAQVSSAVLHSKEIERWVGDEIYERFAAWRRPFNSGSAAIVRSILSTLDEQSSILEVGSGLGHLSSLVPELNSRIQQSDGSRSTVESNLRINPSSNIVHLDALSLRPFGRDFDHIVGFASYDVLPELNGAIREVANTLRSGGKFLHFADLQPSLHPIFFNETRPDFALFPLVELGPRGASQIVGLREISLHRLALAKSEINPAKLPLIDRYVKQPQDMYITLDSPAHRAILHDLGREMNRLFPLDTRTFRFNEYFSTRMRGAAVESGLIVRIDSVLQESTFENREIAPICPAEHNVLVNHVGVLETKREDLSWPDSKVRCTSEMMVFVAEKP